MANAHAQAATARNIDDVAAEIEDFYGLHNWYPAVTRTVKDLTRPDTRLVTLRDGSQLAERLLDHGPGRVRYRSIDAGPLRGFEAVLAVGVDRDGSPLITWDATFACDPAIEQEVIARVRAAYQAGLGVLATERRAKSSPAGHPH